MTVDTMISPTLALLLQTQPQPSLIQQLIPFALIFVVFWFFLFRPARARQKAHQEMVSALKRGDKVITNGGLYGVVSAIDETVVHLKISDNTKVRVAKSAISGLEGEPGADSGGTT